ncbi:hypothetical protein N6G02_23785 [Cupriavidus gilardii]|uniref:Uncharacterized protein n=1 Tax=Cupriavidus gilardii TaxID=82541 RepID=A0ABY4VNM6_9BURK|nr:hypothetical protein [Cupriavidus gilardii]MCT9119172.1 hypothetical protein [Cupriavidus gilardii]MCT9125006.1 hypothetical protein [Cupriavidus gilardii]USE78641.1 hypothetical protein NDR89_18465 [Cupriavidus gilardii]
MTRQIKNKAEIRAMIRAEQAKWPECKEACFGDICVQTPDATGCNWGLSKMEGEHAEACMARIQPFIESMKAQFSVPEEEKRG